MCAWLDVSGGRGMGKAGGRIDLLSAMLGSSMMSLVSIGG